MPRTRPFIGSDFAGLPCYGGLDLASTNDLASFVVQGQKPDGVYRLTSRFWCPEDNLLDLERKTRMPYRLWADKGWLIPTPGNVIDYSFIRQEIVEIASELDLRKIFSDAWNAQKLAIELRDHDGIPIDFLTQGFKSLSEPTKEFKRRIDAHLIEHDGNPVMRWCVGNAIAVMDAQENVKLDKKKSRSKIDGAAAAVNSTAASMAAADAPSVYESRGVRVV